MYRDGVFQSNKVYHLEKFTVLFIVKETTVLKASSVCSKSLSAVAHLVWTEEEKMYLICPSD